MLLRSYSENRNKNKGLGQDLGTIKNCLGIRNKNKGLGQGFRNNKKIVQELGTKKRIRTGI